MDHAKEGFSDLLSPKSNLSKQNIIQSLKSNKGGTSQKGDNLKEGQKE